MKTLTMNIHLQTWYLLPKAEAIKYTEEELITFGGKYDKIHIYNLCFLFLSFNLRISKLAELK